MLELFAHGLAYSNQLNPEQKQLLTQCGYNDNWQASLNDNEQTGLFVGLLIPTEDGKMVGRKPVVAFRGSEMSDPETQNSQFSLDWLKNDMDPYAVGYTAFMLNYQKIQTLIQQGNERGGEAVVVTGHSLGGSLASQAAIHFPDLIASAVTFQSPGINPEQVRQVEERMKRGEHTPDMTSYTSEGDIVDFAGGGRYPGANRTQINPAGVLNGHTPMAHTLYLLSTPEFAAGQAELGQASQALTGGATPPDYKAMLSSSSPGHPQSIQSDGAPYQSDSTTHETIERLRQDLVAHMYSPNADLVLDFSDRIAQMPIGGRINIMQNLMIRPNLFLAAASGGVVGALAGTLVGLLGAPITAISGAIMGAIGNTAFVAHRDINTTQVAINRILSQSSAQEKVQIIDHCGGIQSFHSRLQLGNETTFQSNLIGSNGYYAGLSVMQAVNLVKQNLGGGGFLGMGNGAEEEIVAYLLVNHPEAERVITLVGGGDYDKGLEQVLRVVQGTEDDIVSSRFAFRNRSRGMFW
jgi:pimeloyl-ACP methyl ester carboxylesterase/uncharacterized MnhB-related membrane protein